MILHPKWDHHVPLPYYKFYNHEQYLAYISDFQPTQPLPYALFKGEKESMYSPLSHQIVSTGDFYLKFNGLEISNKKKSVTDYMFQKRKCQHVSLRRMFSIKDEHNVLE